MLIASVVNSLAGVFTLALPAAKMAGTAWSRDVIDLSRSEAGAKSRFIRSLTEKPAIPAYIMGFTSHLRRVSRSSSSERISPSSAAASI